MVNKINKGNQINDRKKVIIVIGIVIITILLMFFFKYHPNRKEFGDLFKKSKANLVELYTKNLKPLLFQTELTNEDIFNFALYGNLPIDKRKDKYLFIINKRNGNTYYEIRKPKGIEKTDNYEKFVKRLKLTEIEKTKLDSILDFYKNNISTLVLSNNRNTIAIDAQLALLNKSLNYNLLKFQQNVLKGKLKTIPESFAKFKNYNKIEKLFRHTQNNSHRNFLFISPDTVFNNKFVINKSFYLNLFKNVRDSIAIKKYLNSFQKRFISQLKQKFTEKKSPAGSYFTYKIDSNLIKIRIPNKSLSKSMQQLNNLFNISISKKNSLASQLSLKFKADTVNGRYKFNIKGVNNDSLFNINVSFNVKDFENISNDISEIISSENFDQLSQYKTQFDSLMESFQKNYRDSSNRKNITKVNIDFKKLRELLDKIKEEKGKLQFK